MNERERKREKTREFTVIPEYDYFLVIMVMVRKKKEIIKISVLVFIW